MSHMTASERRQLTGWPCRSAHLWTGRLMDSHQYPLNMLLGVYCGRLCWRIVISRELGSGYNVQHAFSFTCSASNSVETYFSKRSLNVDACTKLAKPHNEDRRTDRPTAAPLFQPEPHESVLMYLDLSVTERCSFWRHGFRKQALLSRWK